MSASADATTAMHGAAAATRLIIAASVGNALEFYEILVYGYFAVIIAKVFFPAADEAVSILVTFGTFGVSFLARPVGAIFLGAYGDRHGRKRALTLSILLMTIGTGLMTVMPSYGSVGLTGAGPGDRRAAAAGLFGRRRVRQLDRVSGRASSRPRRLFRQLAMVEPGIGRAHRHGLRRLADDHHVGCRSAVLGLAHSVRLRAADRAGRLLHPQPLAETPEFLDAGASARAVARSVRRAMGPAAV